jgi:cell division GTPase FtsZ
MASHGRAIIVNEIETKAYRQAPLWATQEKGEIMTGMFTYVENENSAKIKVIGVGGAGGNAINNMIASNLQGVQVYFRQHG